ncbi:protein of unassigned function [Methylobacterium oryzae CBMB20]|uniref:Protein of unassigned function n=1 Tax=Methylobacterium oryzae CBMB20 TaxID=693986 RepID=A0A089NTG3_9HYPH|nr:protein of unassigned function [Methylobacterium oryzae CBMB20]
MPVPCIPDAKIGGYLLDDRHAEGGPKAAFFLSRGFTREDPRSFIAALLEHGCSDNLVASVENRFVIKYICEGPMQMPDGSRHPVRSVWKQIDDGALMALVTAYPITPPSAR